MDQTPRPDESRDDHQDHQRDLDAEFAALMGDVEIPDDLSTEDLGAEQATGSEPGRQAPVEDGSVSTGSAGESGPADVRPDDVPHNTYRPPERGRRDNGGLRPLPAHRRSGGADRRRGRIPELLRARSARGPGSPGGQGRRRHDAAEPGRRSGRNVLPAGPRLHRGALLQRGLRGQAVRLRHSDWDVAELLGGSDSEPAEAAELAAQLSRLSRAGAVLMTADLATDVGIESGLSGTITARHFTNGQPGEEASAGSCWPPWTRSSRTSSWESSTPTTSPER